MSPNTNPLPPFPAPTPIAAPTPFAAVAEDGKPLPLLFTPLKLRGVTLHNRIGVSPMCQFSSTDGFINMFHAAHLGKYALYGAGLIIVEATAVHPHGRISTSCTGLWKDEHIAPLREIADFVHSQGSKLGIQIFHAGRKSGYNGYYLDPAHRNAEPIADAAHGGWPADIIAPSAIKGLPTDGEPREATLDEIAELVAAFGQAARRANEAGLDVLEVHGAHGYLINEFLSPLTNQRTDKYGGSFENRIRFLVEVVREVRKFWPADKPLFVRLSCSDWAEGGWTSDDTVQLSKVLAELDVDVIDCSSGANIPSEKPAHAYGPGWNVPFSEAIKQGGAKIHTAAVGGITDAEHAESILQDGKADIVLLAREFLRNPTWVPQAAQKLGVKAPATIQYRAGFAPKK
ncbi:hypothetical protein HK105_209279 [Polyrhizophydium stewartii]|uniref:NADH:flavin oxidoreductase/NADH oxidase N-terminal domain-containing protein n=1 Tax=Polyrhizophydium stewartii TaxID=2732419 RepID=A0ABR4MVI3_9FUNG